MRAAFGQQCHMASSVGPAMLITLLMAPAALHADTDAAGALTVPPIMVITVAADATAIESRAAHELAYFIGKLVASASTLQVVTPAVGHGKPQFAVGPAAARALGVAPTDLGFADLGTEGFLVSSNRTVLLRKTGSYALSGAIGASNASTGTLFAVHHLLRHFGVRFFAWDELHVPPAAHG